MSAEYKRKVGSRAMNFPDRKHARLTTAIGDQRAKSRQRSVRTLAEAAVHRKVEERDFHRT